MVRINEEYYLERRPTGRVGRWPDNMKGRTWWLIKAHPQSGCYVSLSNVLFPIEMLGKKIRIKIEVLE